MRVTFVSGSSNTPNCGVEDYTRILAHNLERLGVQASWVDRSDWLLTAVPDLLRAVRNTSPDAVLLNYPASCFGHSLAPQAWAMLQSAAPLFVTLHEFSAAHIARRISILPLVARARRVIMTTTEERQALLRWYPWIGPNTTVIPISTNIPVRDRKPDADARVIYFGQIRPEKGIDDFIDCALACGRERLGYDFEIIGSPVPKFAAYHEAVMRRCAEAGVAVRSGLPPESVADVLAGAAAALLPFPDGATFRRGSLLAAAACGVPIITRVGEQTPPLIRNAVLAAGTTQEAVGWLRWLAADPSHALKLQEPLAVIRDFTSWEAIAERYMSLFERAVSRP